ncbi:TetR/AcrR family transcriptional regulator [Dongia deserti]|uniref:TetR/AcrR family transcriptional regulator n=1 Tax=Dongia deserti TaxID=2268030 RepID=UPI000E64F66C|nr:TetR/AcrR family transcriptional regulator [Dongia deserti]
MTETPRKRGRPPAYDPDKALASARDVFWSAGYEASSLDELSAAMAMNRPSVYGAFGDKEALYLKTLARYRDESVHAMRATLDPAKSLREGLATIYRKSIDTYLAGGAARGCLLIGTATTEAVSRAAVRDLLRGSLQAFDAVIEDRLKLAGKRGELAPKADPKALALIASAIMHSLAVRARAGEPRKELEKLARAGVALICG